VGAVQLEGLAGDDASLLGAWEEEDD
jgi:hypothetical protein